MRAYYYDNEPGDQRELHDSGRVVDEAHLAKLGIFYRKCPSIDDVNALAEERGYKNRDELTVSPDKLGEAYPQMIQKFFSEHLHEDEEIRYCLDGTGFFDVRSEGDDWVRIKIEKDDLLIVPAGIYHRFTTGVDNYIKAVRLFQDEPKWTPLNRGPDVDVNQHRKQYVEWLNKQAVPTA